LLPQAAPPGPTYRLSEPLDFSFAEVRAYVLGVITRFLETFAVDGVELLLEPSSNSLSRDFQQALYEQGISGGQFNSSDIQAEYERLSESGVEFTMTPTDIGPAIMAVFNDTCGNFITLVQEKEG